MVYLTGDTHGELDRFKDGGLRRAGKGDFVVVLGDFGFVWDGSKAEQKNLDWLRKRPYTILFLDGSHENYDLLEQYPTEERFGGLVQPLGGNGPSLAGVEGLLGGISDKLGAGQSVTIVVQSVLDGRVIGETAYDYAMQRARARG